MPLLAQLVVEYAIDVSQLTAGATAAAESMAAVDDAAAASNAYLDSLGESAFSCGVGFDGMAASADAALASVADASDVAAVGMSDFNSVVDVGAMSASEYLAYISEASMAMGVFDESTLVAMNSTDGLNVALADTSVAAGTSAVSLDAVALSENGVAASLAKTSLAADKAAVSMDAVSASEKDVAASSEAAKTGLGGMGLALAAVAIAAGVATVASVKMAGDFQSAMTRLVTTAGESQKNIKMVSDGILDMSVQVGVGAKDLSDAMYWVESAGFHGAKALDTLKIAAMGAKAENADVTGVVKVLTSALNTYSGTGITAAQAMNTLIAATGQGKMTLNDLAGAVSNVLPVSAKFGISLADTTGALATMTMQGDDAASAATHLRQIILALEAPAKAGASALASIGLSSQVVSDKMRQSLPDAIQMITDALGKKFPEGSAAYNNALKNIAGGNKQLLALLETSGGQLNVFKANVDAITGAVKAGGDSIMGWSLVQDNFNFKMDQAKAFVEKLGIQIGTFLLPILGNLLSAFTSPGFQQFVDGAGQKIIEVFGAISDLLNSRVVPVLQNFWQFIQTKVIPVLQSWGNTIKIWALDKLTDLESFLETKVVPALQGFWQFVQTQVIPTLQTWGSNIKTWVIDKFNDLKTYLETKVIPGLQDFWQWVQTKVVPVLQTWGNAIKTYAIDKLNDLKTFIETQVIPKLSNLWGWIQGNVISAFSNWRQEIQNAQTKLNELKTFIDTRVIPVLQTIWGWIQANVMPVFKALGDVITKDVIPPFHDIWNSIQTNLWPALVRLWQTLGPILTPAFEFLAYVLTGQVADGLHHTKDNVEGAGGALKSMLEGVSHIIDGLSILINWLITAYTWFKNLTDAIAGAATAIITFPSTVGKDLGKAIPHFASGVENFSGGMALVGENGPELVNLPGGSSVMNAAKTSSLYGANTNRSPLQGGSGKQEIHIHNYIDGKEITNNTMNRVMKELRGHGLKA